MSENTLTEPALLDVVLPPTQLEIRFLEGYSLMVGLQTGNIIVESAVIATTPTHRPAIALS